MHYMAFLILWLPLPDDAPPVTPPKAAFINRFDTIKECKEYQNRIINKDIKKQTACMLVVVEPKEGIKE